MTQITDLFDLYAHAGLNACHFLGGSVRGEAPHKNSGGSGRAEGSPSKDFLHFLFFCDILRNICMFQVSYYFGINYIL